MRFVLFCHSLISDWNHGNAHFLRGIASELIAQGHSVRVYEPADNWSLRNLREQHGETPIAAFHAAYPGLQSCMYELATLDLDEALDGADVVIVHEWNDPNLVKRIGRHRALARTYRLFFHDTHHRAVSAPDELRRFDLTHYDGVLAFGEVLRQIYEDRGWAARAWTWHEGADTRVFRPLPASRKDLDLVWIGNWGDGERAEELSEHLLDPVRTLQLRARIHGVRYPPEALVQLGYAGVWYAGWLPNYRVPEVFASARMTVHVPRAFYRHSLPGIPTIRMFEALACGIPLVSAPWDDCEHLFEPDQDYLVASNGRHMREHLRMLRADPDAALVLAESGLNRILSRHTCAHRVQELLNICRTLSTADARAGKVA